MLAGKVLIVTILVLWSLSPFGTIINLSVAQATERQGGGLFKNNTIKKQKPKRIKKKSKNRAKSPPVSAHNYDGKYKINMQLLSNSSSIPCHSGSKNMEIRNNRAALKTWAFGDTIGGRISGNTMALFGQNKGVLSKSRKNPWKWSGQLKLPKSRTVLGTGTLQGLDHNGNGCRWKAKVHRL